MSGEKLLGRPKILVTTDFSESSYRAFPYAEYEVSRRGAEGLLLHVYEERYTVAPFAEAAMTPELQKRASAQQAAAAKSRTDELVKDCFRTAPFESVVTDGFGSVADRIADFSRKHSIDRIVMASQGEGFLERFAVGSVTEEVMRQSPCELLIIPSESKGKEDRTPEIPFRRIAVATDFSELSTRAFPVAASEARLADAEIDVIHVMQHLYAPSLLGDTPFVSFEDGERIQAEYRAALDSRLSAAAAAIEAPRVTSHIVDRSITVAESISEYVRRRNIDLLVFAARSSDKPRWVSRIAEKLLRRCCCPILIVPVK